MGIRKEQENSRDFSWQHPEVLLRYGLFENLELRLHTTVETQRYHTKAQFNDGLTPVELGLKTHVFQTKDTNFTTSLYGHIGLPRLASKDHQHSTSYYRVRALFENKLTEKIKLNSNIGRDWDKDNKEQNWMYALSPQFEIGEKWEASIEEYAFFKKGNNPEHYIDGGLGYFAGQHVKLDVNAGKGLGGAAADYFVSAGVSFKL